MNDISNLSKDEIQNIVKQKIKNNTKFLDQINQYLHNQGIEIVTRYEIVNNVLLESQNFGKKPVQWLSNRNMIFLRIIKVDSFSSVRQIVKIFKIVKPCQSF